MRGQNHNKRKAFTMNELMIAGAVIGIIASITVPTLLADTNKKRNQITKDKVNLAMISALKSMRIEGNLTGNETTEQFLGEFRKHLNLNKICAKEDLENCFASSFKINEEENSLKNYKTSQKLGKDWNTNINGAILQDGTSILIAYNPNCSKFEPSDCISVIYDTNGKKPNNSFIGGNGVSDIGMFNVLPAEVGGGGEAISGCSVAGIKQACGGFTMNDQTCIIATLESACVEQAACEAFGSQRTEGASAIIITTKWKNNRCFIMDSWTDPI